MARAPEAGPICMPGPLLGPARISAPGPRGTGLPQGSPLPAGEAARHREVPASSARAQGPPPNTVHPSGVDAGWASTGPSPTPASPSALGSELVGLLLPLPHVLWGQEGEGQGLEITTWSRSVEDHRSRAFEQGVQWALPWVGAVLGPLPDPKKPGAGGPLPFPGAALCLVCQPGRTDRAGEEGADCWAPPSRPFSSPPPSLGSAPGEGLTGVSSEGTSEWVAWRAREDCRKI